MHSRAIDKLVLVFIFQGAQLFGISGISIFRRISAVMEVPYYTTTIYPGARLVLDDKGLPVYQGMASATFTVSPGGLRMFDYPCKVLFCHRCLFHIV